MQEQLGRLMVGAAAGAWDTRETSRKRLDQETAELLAQVPIFATLSRRHLGRIAGIATAQRYAAKAPLVRAGEPADAFYVILAGDAGVDLRGQKLTRAAGDFFGEMGLLDGEPRTATVSAVSDVLVLVLRRKKFLEFSRGRAESGARRHGDRQPPRARSRGGQKRMIRW